MAFSDDPALFNKELLDIMYEVLRQHWEAGAPLLVKKDDYTAKYNTPTELQAAIKKQENKITMTEAGCIRVVCSV